MLIYSILDGVTWYAPGSRIYQINNYHHAENYDDRVDYHSDHPSTLNDLFLLESKLNETETQLLYTGKMYLVRSEVNAMKHYINELLWYYRSSY